MLGSKWAEKGKWHKQSSHIKNERGHLNIKCLGFLKRQREIYEEYITDHSQKKLSKFELILI